MYYYYVHYHHHHHQLIFEFVLQLESMDVEQLMINLIENKKKNLFLLDSYNLLCGILIAFPNDVSGFVSLSDTLAIWNRALLTDRPIPAFIVIWFSELFVLNIIIDVL